MNLLDELAEPALAVFWQSVRRQLEKTGLRAVGTVVVDLDDVAADFLGGVLGARVRTGRRRLALDELDAVLRASPAALSLVDAAVALHGPLRDLPAQRSAKDAARVAADAGWAALLALRRAGWRSAVPFGPPLLVGAGLALALAGPV
ncbi:hypothetical protein GCM10023162_34490 [Klenkia terrae]